MPKVACVDFGAEFDARFYSNDHLPPHFHVEKTGRWQVRVFFRRAGDAMIEVVWGPGPNGREQRAIIEQAEAHRVELEEEWSDKVSTTVPGAEE